MIFRVITKGHSMRASRSFVSASTGFYVLTAALVASACSESTTPSTAAKLAFTALPLTVIAAKPINPSVVVTIQDADGRTVTGATTSVTLSIGPNSPAGTLAGTVTVAAVDGVAVFPNISIDKAGSGYTLSATAPNLAGATSSIFAVIPGAPVKLGFTVQPATALANTIFPAISVAVQDAGGNTVTGAAPNVALAIGTNPGNASLSGATVVPAVNGVATFSNVSVTAPGNGYTLVASAQNLGNTVSAPFNMTVGAATRLGFVAQPTTSGPGEVMPAVRVAIQDVAGNTVATATNTVTLGISTNAGNGTLSGTKTASAVNGVATFADLSIDNTGAGYTLSATAPALVGALSASFTIRHPLVFAMVSAGYFHACGLTTGGESYCWGENTGGQLGDGTSTTRTSPVLVSGAQVFDRISAGRSHTCGLTASGPVYCWGSIPAANSNTPVAVSGDLTFAEVTAGYAHTCGVTTVGAGYCWGDNTAGALGNNSLLATTVPTPVSGGLTFARISTGRLFSCGLTTTGAGYCWGDNTSGLLGDGTNVRRLIPVPIGSQLTFTAISAGGFHACGLTTAGAVYCWGSNDFGELGIGTKAASLVPVPIATSLSFVALTVGNRHNCALTASGAAYCWGDATDGLLGNGSFTGVSTTPVAVSGGLVFASVSAGRFHTCGVTTNGTAYCWGNNRSFTLGDGTNQNSALPVRVR
jgi:alpha-tubulin suppressor-like RCC1 family protein